MKTFLLLAMLIVFSSLGEILSAKGMQQIGDVSFHPRKLIGAILRMIRNPYLIAGVACSNQVESFGVRPAGRAPLPFRTAVGLSRVQRNQTSRRLVSVAWVLNAEFGK